MATLLHLSDLHLGGGAADETLGEHKLEVIAYESRQKRSTALAATLTALGEALRREHRVLDAVVVSGDVTYKGASEGFDNLVGTLSRLGEALPDPSRIMVVPGNHDVQWGTPPSTPQRYQAFVDGTRTHGYVTPYLEGIDINADGEKISVCSPVLVAGDSSFIIVALNSANHCGIRVQEHDDLRSHAERILARGDSDPDASALLKDWQANSLYDIARIEDQQRHHAALALNEALGALDDPSRTVRIAVLHHQLLPISLDEEIKPFEALTNLAQVRDWLALNHFDLVLHGHKHVAALYEDRYVPLSTQMSSQVLTRVLLSAVGTVGLGQTSSNTIARLIEVDRKLPTLGRVRATAIPAQQHGIPLKLSDLTTKTYLTRPTSREDSAVLEGASPREVHEQLLALFDENRPVPKPLICRVVDGTSAGVMPASYAELASVPSDAGWFSDLVRLWQAQKRLSAMQFNHGERIFNMRGIDQLGRAIEWLRTKESSSRAVIALIDQDRDTVKDIDLEFPAFCLIQLFVVNNRLCILGYFRKQEMRYWWAINAAELAELQRRALAALNVDRGNVRLEAGEIITVTALPTAGGSVPRVAVPRVDRWVDEHPDRLLRMALVAYDPHLPTAAEAVVDWKETAEECRPREGVEAADGDPIPVAGLEAIMKHLQSLRVTYGGSELVEALDAALDRSVTSNRAYLNATRRGASPNTVEGAQATQAHEHLVTVISRIANLVAQTAQRPAEPSQ